MILTTTNNIENFKIVDYLGIVTGSAYDSSYSSNGKKMSFKDMFSMSKYREMYTLGLESIKEKCLKKTTNYHHGNLPVWNAVVQFFSAAIGLAGGLSIGKEGPAVHLGATLGGYLAEKAKLPQYGVETLLACGVAGAISAIFQTPLAGVLFAFEVIFLEYRQRYVLPVLLSSVIATLVSHFFIGPLDIFSVESISSVLLSIDLFFACSVLVIFIVLLSALFLHTQLHALVHHLPRRIQQ